MTPRPGPTGPAATGRRSAGLLRPPPPLLPWLVAAVALVAPAPAACQAGSGLNVLLTNDDGFDAPGIAAMREALVAAGHSVTVVAPLDDRSGAGMGQTTSGVIDYYEQSAGVWAIDGTPADAVALALVHVMRDDPPDVVVSGVDFGQNVGANLLESGTVGAVLAASRQGVPAIAVSAALDLGEQAATPPFRSTTASLGPAADFVADLLGQLHESDARGLLPPRQVLNVNYPAVGSGEPAGVRFAPVASVRALRRVYAVGGPTGPATVELAGGDPDRAEGGSDYDLLADGFVTISVLEGNVDAGRASWEPLLERLVVER